MFFLYQIIIFLVLLLSPTIIIFRIFRNKEDKTRFFEKFSLPSRKRRKGKLIWFHGASVGEILSIIPLIKNYEKEKSINQILITSSTLSSSKILSKFRFKKTVHQFYPLDNIFLTNKFLKIWQPSLAVFIESEVWPCMFKNIAHKNIPLILLNARLTKKTFSRWMKIENFSRSVFKNVTIAFPQNIETKSYLEKLKINKITNLGNLKFAQNHDDSLNNFDHHFKKELKSKKIWIASSTHKSEELFCAKAHLELRKKIKNLITIIIPRHIDRSEDICSEIKKLNLEVTFHSSKPKSLKNTDIYIVDKYGETKKFHKIGSSVFLGGSIIKRGGQNPLEAARYGAKILHGPNVDNFKDIYRLLKSLNISKKINSPKSLSSSITFSKNKITGNRIKNMGEIILKKTIKELDKLIVNEFKKT